MTPKIFDDWVKQVYIPRGVGVRPSKLLLQFKQFASPRFQKLSRVDFYDWVRESLSPIEEKDFGGIVFYFGQKGEKPKEVSWQMLIDCTHPAFASWFNRNKEEFLYGTQVAKYLHEMFVSEYPNVGVEMGSLSKQRFNEWLRWACLHYTGRPVTEGRNHLGRTFKFLA
jgi:hypothetical protein